MLRLVGWFLVGMALEACVLVAWPLIVSLLHTF